MKHTPSLPSLMSFLATAATVLFPLQPAAADDGYRVDTHGPRIGSRIVLFFKDLAYGQNPNDRYRYLPGSQPRMAPQPYGTSSGPGYNLDQPPPVNSMPPQRMAYAPAPPPSREMAPADLPYTTDAAPPKERQRKRELADESMPAPRPKSKTPPPQKPAMASKPAPEEKEMKSAPPKETAPVEASVKDTQTASNSPSTRRSWQMFNGNSSKETKATTQATEEPKPETSIRATTSSATLTGSKTTKEGRVKSPYAPFNELDVTGLPAGSLAMDPTTGKVFRVP